MRTDMNKIENEGAVAIGKGFKKGRSIKLVNMSNTQNNIQETIQLEKKEFNLLQKEESLSKSKFYKN